MMSDDPERESGEVLIEGRDFYWEGTLMVLTADYLRRRGYCCNSGCRNCPYPPKDEVGKRDETR